MMRFAFVLLTVSILTLCSACASQDVRTPFRYAVVESDHVIARDESVDVQLLAATRQTLSSDFVWFDRDGSEYVVTDAGIVARAIRTIEPIRDRSMRAMTKASDVSYQHRPDVRHRDETETLHAVTSPERLSAATNEPGRLRRALRNVDAEMRRLTRDALSRHLAKKVD